MINQIVQLWVVSLVVWSLGTSSSFSQESSLFLNPRASADAVRPASGDVGNPMQPSGVAPAAAMIPNPYGPQMQSSFTYQPPPKSRVLRVHDIVQIRVDEMSRMIAEGNSAQRKNAIYQAALEEWIRFEGWSLKKDQQSDGDPEVSGINNQTFQARSTVNTRESLIFNIAAEIADIRPNGNIVLEAHKSVTINDNRWQVSLSGECQDTAIGPDMVVLSRDVINLQIDKKETGQARDGYRRGWFTEWFSKFQPF